MPMCWKGRRYGAAFWVAFCAALLCGAMWLISYEHFASYRCSLGKRTLLWVESCRGALGIEVTTWCSTRPANNYVGWTFWQPDPGALSQVLPSAPAYPEYSDVTVAGNSRTTGSSSVTTGGRRTRCLILGMWMLTAFFAGSAIVAFIFGRSRPNHLLCKKCGYALIHLTSVYCPECGTAFEPPSQRDLRIHFSSPKE